MVRYFSGRPSSTCRVTRRISSSSSASAARGLRTQLVVRRARAPAVADGAGGVAVRGFHWDAGARGGGGGVLLDRAQLGELLHAPLLPRLLLPHRRKSPRLPPCLLG